MEKKKKSFIPMYVPNIAPYTTSAIQAIEDGWISNLGENVKLASEALARAVGVPEEGCILMANGTCATHCLFLALKFKHPEIRTIYVPNNVYVAVWNAALMVYSPKTLRVLPMNGKTWNADFRDLDDFEQGAAVVVVHNVGNIIDVNAIHQRRPDLVLVEDNCEGLFGRYPDGTRTGSSHALLASSCSFYGNKIITTGEGGAFFTHDLDVAQFIRRTHSQGMSGERYIHNVHAYNYRMTNVQAGFLLDQLQDLTQILETKRNVWQRYQHAFRHLIEAKKVILPEIENGATPAPWMFAIQLPILARLPYREVHRALRDRFRVDCRPFFYPIGCHEHLSELQTEVDAVSAYLTSTVLMLPSSPTLSEEEIARVVEAIERVLSLDFFSQTEDTESK
jgi:perosamine synthetase